MNFKSEKSIETRKRTPLLIDHRKSYNSFGVCVCVLVRDQIFIIACEHHLHFVAEVFCSGFCFRFSVSFFFSVLAFYWMLSYAASVNFDNNAFGLTYDRSILLLIVWLKNNESYCGIGAQVHCKELFFIGVVRHTCFSICAKSGDYRLSHSKAIDIDVHLYW